MAENEQGQEKTEQPTSKRLQDARERGEVAGSRELSTLAMLLASAAALLLLGGRMGARLAELMRKGLAPDPQTLRESGLLLRAVGESLVAALEILWPLLAVLVAAALVAPLLLGSVTLSARGLMPNLQRISPLAGWRRIFGWQGLSELAKALVKAILVAGASWALLRALQPELLTLGDSGLGEAVAKASGWVGWTLLVASLALIPVVVFDVPFQWWSHRHRLRMTREELREEIKGTEGNPEIKSKLRQLQREAANRRMMAEVPKADVVVTNPTHFAVALKYDESRMAAPRVVARGVDLLAGQIRELATAHGVPLVRAPPLARALYRSTDLGQEIPAPLYLAVAQVLAYVYQLRAATTGDQPQTPENLDVPDEFLR